jgi:hypothetical protein
MDLMKKICLISGLMLTALLVSSMLVSAADFRSFYGISWVGDPCDNLKYAKSMSYDYVVNQDGMGKCSSEDKNGLKFYIQDPEFEFTYNYYTWVIDINKNYSQSQIDSYNQVFSWKGTADESVTFPYNLATGWWFTNHTFRPNPDFQQQIVIDQAIDKAISTIHKLENVSIGWEFGGWAWDVPDLAGDWWTERQAGYTGSSWMCGDRACAGRNGNLSMWNNGGIDSGSLHGNITHEYDSYSEARAALYKQLFSRTMQEYPDMKLYYQPYGVYSWIKTIKDRPDIQELMPPQRVFLCQEAADSWTNDVSFLTDTRIYSTGLIAKDYTCNDNPDNHDIDRSLVLASNIMINGAWMGWYGRFGGTDGTTSYQSIRDVPPRLKLIRAIPDWENKNGVIISDRHWDSINRIYQSTKSYADMKVIYSNHPDNGDIYAVVIDRTGNITIDSAKHVTEIYSVDGLFQRASRADSDFTINGNVMTLNSASNQGNGYIIVTEEGASDPPTPTAHVPVGGGGGVWIAPPTAINDSNKSTELSSSGRGAGINIVSITSYVNSHTGESLGLVIIVYLLYNHLSVSGGLRRFRFRRRFSARGRYSKYF